MLEKVLQIRYWRKGDVGVIVEVVDQDLHLQLRPPQSQQYRPTSQDHPVLHHKITEMIVDQGVDLQGHQMFQLLQKTGAAERVDAGVVLQILEKIEIEILEEPEVRLLVGQCTAVLVADLRPVVKA